jgi:hypothetical protein
MISILHNDTRRLPDSKDKGLSGRAVEKYLSKSNAIFLCAALPDIVPVTDIKTAIAATRCVILNLHLKSYATTH